MLQLTEPGSTAESSRLSDAMELVTGTRVRELSTALDAPALAAKTGSSVCSVLTEVIPAEGSITWKSIPAGGLLGEKVIEPSASVHLYRGSAIAAVQQVNKRA